MEPADLLIGMLSVFVGMVVFGLLWGLGELWRLVGELERIKSGSQSK